jgi:hypothetical protein
MALAISGGERESGEKPALVEFLGSFSLKTNLIS